MPTPKEKEKYTYIKALEKKPLLVPKAGGVSDAQKIVEEFRNSGLEYAEVPTTKEKNAKSLMIGLGRYIRTQQKKGELKDIELGKDSNGRVILMKK